MSEAGNSSGKAGGVAAEGRTVARAGEGTADGRGAGARAAGRSSRPSPPELDLLDDIGSEGGASEEAAPASATASGAQQTSHASSSGPARRSGGRGDAYLPPLTSTAESNGAPVGGEAGATIGMESVSRLSAGAATDEVRRDARGSAGGGAPRHSGSRNGRRVFPEPQSQDAAGGGGGRETATDGAAAAAGSRAAMVRAGLLGPLDDGDSSTGAAARAASEGTGSGIGVRIELDGSADAPPTVGSATPHDQRSTGTDGAAVSATAAGLPIDDGAPESKKSPPSDSERLSSTGSTFGSRRQSEGSSSPAISLRVVQRVVSAVRRMLRLPTVGSPGGVSVMTAPSGVDVVAEAHAREDELRNIAESRRIGGDDVAARTISIAAVKRMTRTAAVITTLHEETQFRKRLLGEVGGVRRSSTQDSDAKYKGWKARLRRPVRPDSRFKQSWDTAFVILLLYTTAIVPFSVAFLEERPLWFQILDVCVDLFFIADIVLTFRTVVIDDGDEIRDAKGIARHYATGWLLIDAVASAPIVWFLPQDQELRALRLLRLLRLARLEKAEKVLLRALDVSEGTLTRLRLVKTGWYICLAGHVSGCVFYLIGNTVGKDQSWMAKYFGTEDAEELNSISLGSYYLASVYWGFSTLSTVGYGDITAHNDSERAFSLFMVLMGAVMFAVLAGKMSALAASMHAREAEVAERTSQLNAFMRFRNLPKSLRERARLYHEFVGRATWMGVGAEAELLDDMSPSLRRSVSLHLNADLLEAVPILKFGGAGFQSLIVGLLRPALCVSGEYVVTIGEAVQAMYFVKSGSLQLVDSYGFGHAKYTVGSFFGEKWMFERKRATDCVRCLTNCVLYMLTREDLAACLDDFPEFRDTIIRVSTLRDGFLKREKHVRKRIQADETKAGASGGVVANADGTTRAKEVPFPPPDGVQSWREVRESQDFATFYKKMLAKSRMLQAAEYVPQPLDLTDTEVPEWLGGLIEVVAANSHESWANTRIADGWRWGPRRDNAKKLHPDLLPFHALEEDTKAFDRATARAFFQVCIESGYSVDAAATPGGGIRLGRNEDAAVRKALGLEPLSAKHSGPATGLPALPHGEVSGKVAAAGLAAAKASDRTIHVIQAWTMCRDAARKHAAERFVVSEDGNTVLWEFGSFPTDTEVTSAQKDAQRLAPRLSMAGEPVLGTVLGSDDDARGEAKASEDGDEHLRWAGLTYAPQEFPAEHVVLQHGIVELVNVIASNAHEVWAQERIKQGWCWGPVRNDAERRHNCLLPYQLLTDAERNVERVGVVATMRLVNGAGYVFRKQETEASSTKRNSWAAINNLGLSKATLSKRGSARAQKGHRASRKSRRSNAGAPARGALGLGRGGAARGGGRRRLGRRRVAQPKRGGKTPADIAATIATAAGVDTDGTATDRAGVDDGGADASESAAVNVARVMKLAQTRRRAGNGRVPGAAGDLSDTTASESDRPQVTSVQSPTVDDLDSFDAALSDMGGAGSPGTVEFGGTAGTVAKLQRSVAGISDRLQSLESGMQDITRALHKLMESSARGGAGAAV